MPTFRVTIIVSLLFAHSNPAEAGFLETLSQSANVLATGEICSTYQESRAKEMFSRFQTKTCETNGSAPALAQATELSSNVGGILKSAEDDYFSALALEHAKELKCAADFANATATDKKDLISDIATKMKMLRLVSRQTVESSAGIGRGSSQGPCPLTMNDLKAMPRFEKSEAEKCEGLIKARQAKQIIIDSIPLSSTPAVRKVIDAYSVIQYGPELDNFDLENEVRNAYGKSRDEMAEEADKLSLKAKKSGDVFDRKARYDLLSDPAIVSKVMNQTDDAETMKALQCKADAKYKSGADRMETGLIVGSMALGAGAGALAKVGSLGSRALFAARAKGLLSINSARIALQVGAWGAGAASAYSAIDKACFSRDELKMTASANSCVSAPVISQIPQDNCLLVSSLNALGLAGLGGIEIYARRLNQIKADKLSALRTSFRDKVVNDYAEALQSRNAPNSNYTNYLNNREQKTHDWMLETTPNSSNRLERVGTAKEIKSSKLVQTEEQEYFALSSKVDGLKKEINDLKNEGQSSVLNAKQLELSDLERVQKNKLDKLIKMKSAATDDAIAAAGDNFEEALKPRESFLLKAAEENDGRPGQANVIIDGKPEKVPATAYRYLGGSSASEEKIAALIDKGSVDLGSRPTYLSFAKVNRPAAKEMQVPHAASVRVELDLSKAEAVELKIPKSQWGDGPLVEPLTRNHPEFGSGGATQFILDANGNPLRVPIKEIVDLQTGKVLWSSH